MRVWLIVALAACERSGASDAKKVRPIDAAAPSRVDRAAGLPSIDTTGCPTTCAPLAQRVPDYAKLKASGCSDPIGDTPVFSDEGSDMSCGQHTLYAGCCDAIVVEGNAAVAMARLGWTRAGHAQRVALAYAYAESIDKVYPIEASDPLGNALGAAFTPPTDTPFGDGVQIDFWDRFIPLEPPLDGLTTLQHLRYRFDAAGAEQVDRLETKEVTPPPVAEGQYKMRPPDAGP